MEPRALSEGLLEALAVGAKVTDGACPGLTARRLRNSTVLEWRGRVRGAKVTLRLGRWPQLSLERARSLAQRSAAVAASGGDPRGRRLTPTSVGGALARYEREHLAFKRTGVAMARTLRRHLGPILGLPLEAVGRAELKAAVEPFVAEGHWAAAHKARALLWAFMRWAEAEELIERAPGRMRLAAPAPVRDHVVPLADCRALFAGALALRARHRAFVRVLMLGAFRREETAALRPEEWQGEVIVLPAARTKQGREHIVPVTATMQKELPALVGPLPVRSFSRIKRRLVAATGADGWTFHDFRRAFSTHLNDAGSDPRVVDRVLGHAVGGVEGVYNRARLLRQMREVLEVWEGMLTQRPTG